jgi:hypothetical protein
MSTKHKFFVILLLMAVIILAWRVVALTSLVNSNSQVLEERSSSQAIIQFGQLFIDKVLRAEGEVNFDTRLELENKVRALNDKDILAGWQKFLASKTEIEAQTNIKDFLALLFNKIN